MCGLFGVVARDIAELNPRKLKTWADLLFELSESRGKEAAGIAFLSGKKLTVYKQAIRGTIFIKRKKYFNLFNKASYVNSPLAFIGHSRLATNGLQIKNVNNQPVTNGQGVLIHNGIVVNDENIWEEILDKKPRFEVDTEVLLELISNNLRLGLSLKDVVRKTYSLIKGSASIALFVDSEPYLTLATNTGSLYFIETKNPASFVFASESYILAEFADKLLNQKVKIKHIEVGKGYHIHLENLTITPFELLLNPVRLSKKTKKKLFVIDEVEEPEIVEPAILTIYSVKNNIEKLKRHNFDINKISKLRRCSKCILPETMPLIDFDKKGICNYCRNHTKIKYKGEKVLKDLIEPYRSKNGEPDSIIAFSGGRDSSYGLHFLKKELGLNPIAYTYDWGMVTDIARQNEARMVGKLGVEHIIVSADITMKRNHIKKHILAWMKKPDLGMVPLFMEGDKQCEYYADELAKKTNVKLIFFARGNEYENEEFKWGHCGISNATPGGVIHNLSFKGKVQIAGYYAKQYLSNPSYFNQSFFDTLFAYYSTYIQTHDYVYLWHYIPWKEDKIVSLLKKEYGWQSEPETKTTWRTDDGTSAFYNYIYFSGQGFTENDTFRSNQIREGILTRNEALRLVREENKPRHGSLKWYFDSIGLDGDKVLSVVDNMPKLY